MRVGMPGLLHATHWLLLFLFMHILAQSIRPPPGSLEAVRQGSLDSTLPTGSTSTDAAVQQETWLVMELCDRGNLQRALKEGLLHEEGRAMMVRCLAVDGLICVVSCY